MKRILTYIFVMLTVPLLVAQNDSIAMMSLIEGVIPPTTINGSTGHNYVSRAVFTQKVKTMSTVSTARAMITTTFYDGLGRKQQTVLRNNNSGKDLADYYEYDKRGRVVRQYLPGAVAGSGNYASLDQITASHATLYPEDATKAYTTIEYDTLVTPRTIITHRAGAKWHSCAGTRTQIHINKISGKYGCKKFTASAGSGALNHCGVYPKGRLYVTSVIDEDNRETLIFKDFNDSVYLHRRVLEENKYADTYYVYDKLGNIRYVVPPMASEALSLSAIGTIPDDNESVQDYCYIYKYDNRNRLEEKKLPGIPPIFYVYDGCDQMRYSQDGNQRNRNVWTAYAYDNQYRIVYTCEVSFPAFETVSSLRVQMSDRSDKSTFVGTTGELGGYTDVTTPGIIDRVESVNYYDNYDYMTLYETDTAQLGYKVMKNYDWRYENADNPRHSALGLQTGMAVSIYGDTLMLPSSRYYDKEGNVIQSCEKNHLGGYDRKLYKLSFVGKPSSLRHEHSTADTSCVDIYNYYYDIHLRPTTVNLSHNGSELLQEFSNTYNSLGMLSSQTLSEGLIETFYQYNTQGWLTHIDNNKFHQQLYYETHPDGGNISLTGNVCAMSWSSDGRDNSGNIAPTIQRTYMYEYDRLDRLTSARYEEDNLRNDPAYQTTNTPDYTTSYTYDLNGNMTTMSRNGLLGRELAGSYELWTFGEIDNVEMSYDGNKLIHINDAAEEVVLSSTMDMTDRERRIYDSNGNLTISPDKNIWQITYNRMNLPDRIVFENNNRITFKYDANGKKLCETYEMYYAGFSPPIEFETLSIAEPQSSTGYYITVGRREYCGNYVYQDGRISMILTPSGYISGNMRYYYLRDNQGNNRVVLNQTGAVQQVNHYYPYGSLMGEVLNTSSQPYRYGGKELVTLGGLNLSDFGARWLDSPSGTFTTMDPLCEDFRHLSPYLYCAGNPLKFVDPDGKQSFAIHGTWSNQDTWQDQAGINAYTQKTFGETKHDYSFKWNGGNYAKDRTAGALKLISYIREYRKQHSLTSSEPITLIGHSHGGNVAIEAANRMVDMVEFNGIKINLLTINTPVRNDYQLNSSALKRVTHINVYDSKDPIQVNGGNASIKMRKFGPSLLDGIGEFGPAGRTFKNATNIKVNNPQGLFGDFHNSHNRTQDWIYK